MRRKCLTWQIAVLEVVSCGFEIDSLRQSSQEKRYWCYCYQPEHRMLNVFVFYLHEIRKCELSSCNPKLMEAFSVSCPSIILWQWIQNKIYKLLFHYHYLIFQGLKINGIVLARVCDFTLELSKVRNLFADWWCNLGESISPCEEAHKD